MPPTFGTDPSLVQAVMAGGRGATFRAKEGVEDNYEEGRARRSAGCSPTKKDVVIGVSASGMTQFVRGALTRARKAGATIIFVTCDPEDRAADVRRSDDRARRSAPEVIAGSTRLKAGTATKLVLNMLTTGAMVRIGKTYGNLMVDVRTGSEKLKDRARRIVNIITGLDYDDADALLTQAQWNVKAADRDAEDRAAATRRRWRASARPTTRCARRSARTSSRACARCSGLQPRSAGAAAHAASSTPRPGRETPRRRRAAAATTRAPASSPGPPPWP